MRFLRQWLLALSALQWKCGEVFGAMKYVAAALEAGDDLNNNASPSAEVGPP